MKDKAAIVIAALMMTSIAFAFSTTCVSATHDETPSIDEDTVKAGTPMVLTITVQNAGPDAIDNVRIIVPSDLTGLAPVLEIPKDNEVTLEDNVVTLEAGTIIEINAGTLRAVENTAVIIPSGTKIRWKPVGENVDGILNENLDAKIVENFDFTVSADAENDELTVDIQATLDPAYGTARLLADTLVVRGTDNKVRLPENTLVQLVSATTVSLGFDNEVKLNQEKVVDLGPDNLINPPTDNDGRTFVALSTAGTNTIYNVVADDNVLIWNTVIAENIAFQAGTVLKLLTANTVDVFENTEVIRAANENVRMTAATATATENQPINWTQATGTSTLPPGPYVEWAGIGDNQIASGDSLDFPFAITTPSAGGDYTIYVKTTDVNGVTIQKEVTLTVDNVRPTVTIAASPSWVKDNVEVTITVTASEPLAKLDNVMVAENNAPENTQITMTPNADNTVWTGTYTTGDNSERDGTATIHVIGAQFEDLVGNIGSDTENTFTVDRLAPPTPELGAITGFPTTPTNVGTWFIEDIAEDNFLGSLVTQEGITVKIRVGTTVHEITTPASGYYSKSITLTEGIQEVGIQYIDKAGNEGTENAENITYDATAPSFTPGTIAGKTLADNVYINDNTPTITLTITDAVLGVENSPFADNGGYSVQLQDADGGGIENLVNALAHDNNTLEFENTIPAAIGSFTAGLPDNTYRLYIVAGDNLQMDNLVIRFVIDTSVPTWTPADAKAIDVLDPVTMEDIPRITNKSTMLISGTAKEANSTIEISADDTVMGTYTTGADGTFSISIEFTTEGIYPLYIQEIDQAGNESTKQLMGTWTVDLTKPSITLTAPEDGISTDESAITVSGTVTDGIDTYDLLTVHIDSTGAYVEKTVYLKPDGSFSTTVPLTEGSNVISVIAQDRAGNRQISTVTVTCTVTPLATYAIIIVIVALVLAAIAIFKKR